MTAEIPPDFWDRVETEKLKYVIYGDTDSLYLSIPEVERDNTKEYVEASEELADEINDIIIGSMNDLILPKMNCEGHNKTFFKSELVMSSILFTDVKKKYCFKEIANEGKIHEEPIIRYTGISVVRSNTAEWTKDFIREIVEDLALNSDVKTKKEIQVRMQEIARKYNNSLHSNIDDLNFSYIGVPCKWGNTKYKRDTAELTGMKLYNTIFKADYFKENTSGLKIPIKIKDPNNFLELTKTLKFNNEFCIHNTPVDKLSFIVVPIYHVKEELKPVLDKFGIEIDKEVAWDKLVDTALDRIIKCIKESYGLIK
jgi:hypothetical protein